MPIQTPFLIPSLSQEAFGRTAYLVMEHLFAIHNDFGRLFDERVYQRELALRMPNVRVEVPILVTHGGFSKRYQIDAVTEDGGVFELKAVEALVSRHRVQLLNYLLLLDLSHGKLVNMRTHEVQHNFVNVAITTRERRQFIVDRDCFLPGSPGAGAMEGVLVPLLNDLGTGLAVGLYEEAVTHLVGGMLREINVIGTGGEIVGVQRFRLCDPRAAFKITAFSQTPSGFIPHCRRLLRHVPLDAIQWVNVINHQVTFTTIDLRAEKCRAEK
jgi:GxxExxY protein